MSQLEANKVVRMLQGKPLKFTVRLSMKDGTERELQSAKAPKLVYDPEARDLFLQCSASGDYNTDYPVVRWSEIALMQAEENPV